MIYMVQRKGFEPSRPNGHMRLKHACLPFHHPRKHIYYNAFLVERKDQVSIFLRKVTDVL